METQTREQGGHTGARLTVAAGDGDEALRAMLYPPQDRSDATKAEINHEWVQM